RHVSYKFAFKFSSHISVFLYRVSKINSLFLNSRTVCYCVMKAAFAFLCGLALASSTLALYDSSDDVIELTTANFNSKVLNSDELWLVEFYAPWCGHCQSLAPAWKQAARALKGVVKVGAVNMDEHQSVGQPYGIRGFPTIKVFGSDKQSPSDYNGARSADSIVDTALSHLQAMVRQRLSGGGSSRGGGGSGSGADVIELTDANFESTVMGSKDLWLVEFFAPWCGHCKQLKPHWDRAASELSGKVKLGALDATVHTSMAARYGIQGYPTIKMFPAGRKTGEAVEYDGGRTSDDIVRWALDKLADSIAPPEIVELTDQTVLQDHCLDKQLCVVSVLPQLLDCQSDCRNGYLKILKEIGEKYKKLMWGWVWFQGGDMQTQLEEAFGIGGFGYPAMAVVNAKKMKFSLLKGPFTFDGINEFVRSLSLGRGSTEPVRGASIPEAKKRDPWDGKDAKITQDDEIDLSELGMESKTEL
ncbi:hypothetical protein BOX15_Mlig030607g2, partial [Macrostomum lignano]